MSTWECKNLQKLRKLTFIEHPSILIGLELMESRKVDPQTLTDLIGTPKLPPHPSSEILFANPESDVSEKIYSLVEELKRRKPSGYSPVVLVHQGSSSESEFE